MIKEIMLSGLMLAMAAGCSKGPEKRIVEAKFNDYTCRMYLEDNVKKKLGIEAGNVWIARDYETGEFDQHGFTAETVKQVEDGCLEALSPYFIKVD
ncbi:MAG: hypothetical protein ABIB71_05695 [Candidatus Woesearchaeota archaeon]